MCTLAIKNSYFSSICNTSHYQNVDNNLPLNFFFQFYWHNFVKIYDKQVMIQTSTYGIVERLQQEVYALQTAKKIAATPAVHVALGPLLAAFPDHVFPTGTVHEFISYNPSASAATSGFMSGLLGMLMQQQGACLWVGLRPVVFPTALSRFGIVPQRILFITATRPKDALWVIEEALKCNALAAVVGEVSELSFTQSRRLQLAVEASNVTGFIHRQQPRSQHVVACTTRWQVQPVASHMADGLPGPGFPRWQVQLLKVRNGRPGTWQFEWSDQGFRFVPDTAQRAIPFLPKRKTG